MGGGGGGSAANAAGNQPQQITLRARTPDRNFEIKFASKRIAHPAIPRCAQVVNPHSAPGAFQTRNVSDGARTDYSLWKK